MIFQLETEPTTGKFSQAGLSSITAEPNGIGIGRVTNALFAETASNLGIEAVNIKLPLNTDSVLASQRWGYAFSQFRPDVDQDLIAEVLNTTHQKFIEEFGPPTEWGENADRLEKQLAARLEIAKMGLRVHPQVFAKANQMAIESYKAMVDKWINCRVGG